MNDTRQWIMLTPRGALHAFAQREPDETAVALQSLVSGARALSVSQWHEIAPSAGQLHDQALAQGWIQAVARALQGPDTQLDDFVRHVIASLSGDRQAVLASDSGFCLGRAGLTQDEADVVSAAAADFSDYARRQSRRGFRMASRFVSFSSDPNLLLPDASFVPFWVDGSGYWLALFGEPLLNNPALVELIWGIKEAGMRFQAPAAA